MDPIAPAPAPPPLQDDMGDETLEELGMTAEEEDDEDSATLDDDLSKNGSAELLSSPHAAKKRAAQTEAVKVNFFILCIITKNDRLESYCL